MDRFLEDFYDSLIDDFIRRPLRSFLDINLFRNNNTQGNSDFQSNIQRNSQISNSNEGDDNNDNSNVRNGIRLNHNVIRQAYNIRRRIEMLNDTVRVNNSYENDNILPQLMGLILDPSLGFGILPNEFEDVKVVLSEREFNKLNVDIIQDEIDNECNICIENFKKDNQVIKLDCNHMFHKECIKKWLCEEKVNCPVCRKDVREFIIEWI